MSNPFDPQQSSPPSGDSSGSFPSNPQPRYPAPDQSGQQWGYGQAAPPSQPYPYGQPPTPDTYGAFGQPAAPSQPYQTFQPPQPGQSGQFGDYGQAGQFGQYGQPGQPSQYPPYGAPAAPSQPYQGYQPAQGQPPYGYPAAPSRPMQTGPGQWSPAPLTQPGMMGMPAQPRKSRRGLWIGLGVALVLILVAAGGGGYVFAQFAAPTAAAVTFCTDLKAQNYATAYGSLSASLHAQISQDQFEAVSKQLDTVEGQVTGCAASTSGTALHYSLGSSTATFAAVITRSTAGSLQGVVRLKNESAGWKVDGLDTSLLGANLSALIVASSLCQDLQSAKYTDAYQLLSSATQAKIKSDDYVQQAKLHDQIDGSVSSCALVALGSGNSDTAASLTVAVVRGHLGNAQGVIALVVEGGAWKVSQMAAAVQGSDLGPLLVGNAFCAALQKGDYAAAYAQLSSGLKAQGSEAQFASSLALPDPFKWNGCTPDYSSYKVKGSAASYTTGLGLIDTSTGQTVSDNYTLSFVSEGGSWKLDDIAQG